MSGALDFDPAQQRYTRGPSPDLLPKVMRAYEAARDRYPDRAVDASYAAFLERALPICRERNMMDAAAEMERRLNALRDAPAP